MPNRLTDSGKCGKCFSPIVLGLIVLAVPILLFLAVALLMDKPPEMVTNDDRLTEFPRSEKSVNRSYPIFDGSKFRNPWPTWEPYNYWQIALWMTTSDYRENFPPPAPPVETLEAELPVKTVKFTEKMAYPSQIELTWIGHATVLVRMEGISIITDPVFSDYCSPIKKESLRRIRPLPCSIEDLPDDLRLVLISHNHYDHLDYKTVVNIHHRFGNRVTFCIPKGESDWFMSAISNVNPANLIEFSWWNVTSFNFSNDQKFQVVSVPAQHKSMRTPFNMDYNLWCGWIVIGPRGRKFYFVGDSGFSPGFKEIGAEFGPIDLAAIPIGAYLPRFFLKSQHVSPEESVQIHLDVQSKQSVAIHWGTFRLGGEPILQPKSDLGLSLKERNLDEKDFSILAIGETLTT